MATPANLVTLARILAAPVFVWLVLERSPSWLVFAVGFAVGITDLLDGWLARRHGGTRSGAFLDPLADKVLVLGGMAALVRVGQFAVVPVALIAARELAVSVYRSGAGRRGISVPATRAAKHKTFVQLWSIGFAIMPPIAENAHWVATATLWVAVVLTLATGAAYLRAASRAGRAGRAAPYLRAASDVRAASAGTPGARAAPHPRTARTVEP
ncbi:MAG TPA: CDP-diacylglycerol--glycerol-3-phosphate 3-phosphatidyltransferase [Acidimicrobiaceae bacterium]|nr:CDP-diacylglycerol--glycerol-3-phosphate 3-phosphatidyltransferase [Acidimicrobiaceae bacterium]